MGLDMYLNRKTYIWLGDRAENVGKINIEGVKPERVQCIIEKFGYWRKANAIHKWFVDNVQDGEDDCKEYYVSVEQLQELLGLVNRVLEDPTLAQQLLPTQEGFFFGSTEYDKWYYEDLELTKKILEEAVKEGGWFTYCASW